MPYRANSKPTAHECDELSLDFGWTFLHALDPLRRISRALSCGGSRVVVFGSSTLEAAPGRARRTPSVAGW